MPFSDPERQKAANRVYAARRYQKLKAAKAAAAPEPKLTKKQRFEEILPGALRTTVAKGLGIAGADGVDCHTYAAGVRGAELALRMLHSQEQRDKAEAEAAVEVVKGIVDAWIRAVGRYVPQQNRSAAMRMLEDALPPAVREALREDADRAATA